MSSFVDIGNDCGLRIERDNIGYDVDGNREDFVVITLVYAWSDNRKPKAPALVFETRYAENVCDAIKEVLR